MGRIKSVWGKDAAEFKPERWLDASRFHSASDIPPGWNGLMAFSAGPRMCIGYCLAVLEFKVSPDAGILVVSNSLMLDYRSPWLLIFGGLGSMRLVLPSTPGMFPLSSLMWLAKQLKDSSFH